MPLLIVASLYASKRKKAPTLENTFNLLAVAAAVYSLMISMFTAFSMMLVSNNEQSYTETIYNIATYTPMVATLALMVYIILRLRRSSDW